ncbi:hypothetical protein L3X38_010534 [Prunus dulcis]|uniref:RNase H type-1 domain-containing protein n=1 Tax=Prunus dulcis TaxID=3755 RepID=A0AAD4WGI3_PRUDU|nr:hypothetical protein L3X38_010534 [Prunus dulcis]
MGIFKFPKSFCQQLEQEIAKFWWGQKQDETKVHWISWATLGLPKKQGGMGFRDFNDFNSALLARQCWRLITEPNSQWAQLWKARYFQKCSFLEAKKCGCASWAWASLLEGREIILQGARWQILNCRQAKLWMDCWIPSLHNAEVPPKIKNFLWRATHGRLPTTFALHKRKIAGARLCPICQAHEEFVEHLLLSCPWVELVWFGGPLNYEIDKQGITTFNERLLKCTTDGLQTKEEKEHISCIIVVTCRIIWKTRNRFVFFYQCIPQPLLAIKTIFSQVEELTALNNRRNVRRPCDGPSPNPASWTAPEAHVIKVNFDATWSAFSGKAGAGLIARNTNGEFVGAKCLSFHAESTIMAKATAGFEGCKWASELGLSEVYFESDSKELIENVKGNIKRGRWSLDPLLSIIRECNFNFSNYNWACTSRKNNEAVDHLVLQALSRSSPEVWVSRPPTSLVYVLNRDGLPCPHPASI